MGLAFDVAAKKVDFPAFGNPRSPASAINFNRNQIVRSTNGCPGFARRGAWFVEDLK